jgi:hypothetical protein
MMPRPASRIRRSGMAAAACLAWLAAALPAPAEAQFTTGSGTSDCSSCGKVESIRQTTAKQQWTPLGTGVGVGGAPSVSGESPSAVTSYRIGPGLTNQGMVVLGSAGGAAYKKAPNSYEQKRWEVTVKMDIGGTRVVVLSYEPYVQEGDHVRISGNNLELVE